MDVRIRTADDDRADCERREPRWGGSFLLAIGSLVPRFVVAWIRGPSTKQPSNSNMATHPTPQVANGTRPKRSLGAPSSRPSRSWPPPGVPSTQQNRKNRPPNGPSSRRRRGSKATQRPEWPSRSKFEGPPTPQVAVKVEPPSPPNAPTNPRKPTFCAHSLDS